MRVSSPEGGSLWFSYQDWDFLTRDTDADLSLTGTLTRRSCINLGEKALSRCAPLRFKVNMVGGDMSNSSSMIFSACNDGESTVTKSVL